MKMRNEGHFPNRLRGLRGKQQEHPQQAQAETVESLGFAGLLRSVPGGVHPPHGALGDAPTMNVNR